MDSTALVAHLQEILPAAGFDRAPGSDPQTTVYASAEGLHATLQALRQRPELQFAFLAELTAVDVWPREPRYELVYILVSIEHRLRLRLKVRLHGSAARVPTASDIWPAANWLEREVWDLFGIEFDGHPDPRRLLMPEDWEGFPLRKDYPVQIQMTPGTSEPMQVTEEEFRASVMKDRLARSDVWTTAFADCIALHERVARMDPQPMAGAAAAIVASLRSGGKLLVFGNGGSASDAQHVAAELVGRYLREREGLAAVALTTDSSVLTSVANDFTYERVFARQVEALGRRGDVALGITTSGESPSVLAAFAAARAKGVVTVALTGRDGGAAGRAAEIHVNVPADSTPRVQEVHRTLLHILCDLVERAFVA